MAKYEPTEWHDEELVGPPRYDVLTDTGTPIYETVQIPQVTPTLVPGTSVGDEGMNNIESELVLLDDLVRAVATPVVIDAGDLIVSQTRHTVSPESETEDEVENIFWEAGEQADLLISFVATNPGTDTIIFKHGVGNISCAGGQDITLSHGSILVYYDGTTAFVLGGGGGGGGGDFSLARIWVAG